MKKQVQKLSEDQERCRRFLSEWVCGDHHLPKVHLFGTGICISFSQDLSTHDFNRLTMLVILAHKYAIRIEIASSGPRMVKIIAHARKHGERKSMIYSEWHPSLADLIDEIRKEASDE